MRHPQRSFLTGLLIVAMMAGAFGDAPPPTPPEVGLSVLAGSAPADAPVFLAMDFRHTTSAAVLWGELQAAEMVSPVLKQTVDQAQSQLGLDLGEVAQWVAPAAFVAILPPAGEDTLVVPGKTPDIVAAFAVTDEKAAEDTLRKLQGQAAGAVGVETDPTQACEKNLKTISSALESYSIENSGHYPSALAQLTPTWLKVIPTCPAAGTDTYAYQVSSAPDAYTVSCEGDHHHLGAHLPAWSSATGLAAGDAAPAGPQGFKSVTVEGCQVWLSPVNAHLAYTVHKGYALAASSTDALAREIRTLDGNAPSLASTDMFQDARRHVSAEDGVLAFSDLAPMTRRLLALDSIKDKVDDQTVAGLTALQYGIVRMTPDPGGLQSEAFIKVDPQSTSPFAHALLTAPQPDTTLVRYFPARWNSYNTADLVWTWHVVMQALALVPSLRPQAADIMQTIKAQTGLDPEQDILGAVSGGYASASNWGEVFPQLVTHNITLMASQGHLVSCESNLKNIGTALEMYSIDHKGHYPKSLSWLVPKYLKRLPRCPNSTTDTYSISYHVQTHPNKYSLCCSGHHHADAGLPANSPRYSSTVGLVLPAHQGDAGTPPAVTALMAIHLRSVEAGQKLIGTVETQLHLKRKDVAQVGDVAVEGYDNPQLRWALVSTPAPVFLISFGPQAETWVETALRTPGSGPSMADQPDYHAVLQETAGKGLVTSDFTDLTPLVSLVETGAHTYLAMVGPQVQGLADLALQALHSMEPLKGTSYIEVEPDGLHMVGHGPSSMVLVGAIGMGAAVFVPSFIRGRSQGQLISCESNERNIGTALEMYATDHKGHYPQKLEQLCPDYLKHIPACPACGRDTYSETYQVGTNPDRYSFNCAGENHKASGVPANYPRYNSDKGLIVMP